MIFLIILVMFLIMFFLGNFNYFFFVFKMLKKKKIFIDHLLIKRIKLTSLQYKKSRLNSIIYGINNYVYNEKDLFTFNIVVISITLVFALIFDILPYDNLLLIILSSIKFLILYLGGLYILNEIVHHIVYRKKRLTIDCIITLLRMSSDISKLTKTKCNGFIGRLFFSNDGFLTGMRGKGKKNIEYKCCDFDKINLIKCHYKENTVVATIETKEDTYEREFSKFIFESDQAEKDYFEALYEFPFMERSTVYDFEGLHNDIMQDLVDEERTFYFKDYLIKEEAS